MKTLLNALAILLLGWIGYVIYCSFAGTGIWTLLVRLWASDVTGRYSPAAVFATGVLMALVPLALVGWLVWRLFLARDRKAAA